jgi:CheY-like chemotaxis protein
MSRTLIVDDEREVLELFGAFLAGDGFEVTLYDRPDNAVAELRTGRVFDLLVTDIRMPGQIDGFELARTAKALLPDLEVIYVSGWVENLSDVRDYVLGPLLPKPVRAEMLCRAARQILRRPPPTV